MIDTVTGCDIVMPKSRHSMFFDFNGDRIKSCRERERFKIATMMIHVQIRDIFPI